MQRTDGLIYFRVMNHHSAGHEKSFLSTNCILGVRPTRAQRWSGPQNKHGPQKQAQAASASADAAATCRLQTGGMEAHRPQPGPAPNHTQQRNPLVLLKRHIHHSDGRFALPPDATPQPPHPSRPPPAYYKTLHERRQMKTGAPRDSRLTPPAGCIRRAAARRRGVRAERNGRQCALTAAVAAEARVRQRGSWSTAAAKLEPTAPRGG